ncbi:putative chitinase [Gammaproteobacteria bacterium]
MLLKVGSTGDNVKKVQTELGLKADGIFGPGTEKAVKTWQSDNGLTADGIIGPATFSKMFPPESVPAGETIVPDVAGLKLDKLSGHIPNAVIAQIPDCAEKFQINSPLRLAHFLAQCAHESAEFKATQENLNYSADGLKKIFSKYFPGDLADSYARQPEKIASRVYGGRMGNGDEASKEGYKFRGRGYIQLTGKNNYRSFDATVEENLLDNPDLVASKYPLLSAAWFWQSRSLNTLADKGATDAIVTDITEKVNGGTIGLADRIKNFKEFYALLA